ncbi:MAG: thioredoxin family protein [Spirochaetes bacterium]|nr:thioredoxin family protein [Spirochaetota bacterium]
MKRLTIAIILAAACAAALIIPSKDTGGTAFAQAKKTLYYFYGRNCPHCAQAAPIVDRLGRSYNLKVEKYEVWYDANNRNRLIKMGKERGKNVQGVPTIIIGRGVYTGSSGQKMEDVVKANLK